MRNFRRLPPFLRVLNIAALLFVLVACALIVEGFVTVLSSFPHRWPMDNTLVIAVNLAMLANACGFVVQSYSTRFRRPRSIAIGMARRCIS